MKIADLRDNLKEWRIGKLPEKDQKRLRKKYVKALANKEIKSILNQIRGAESRAETAYANWDAEAYEGACESGVRYYKRLVELVGEGKAQEMVKA